MVYGNPCYVHLFQTSDGEKKTERAIEKSESSLKEALATLLKKEFACEPDAIEEIKRFLKDNSSSLVFADLGVGKVEKVKRSQGRPGKNSKPSVVVASWKIHCEGIKRNEGKIEEKRQRSSTFALLTNIHPDECPQERYF